jgi:uncharacterized protein YutE (UPF0331/DUF86 family)
MTSNGQELLKMYVEQALKSRAWLERSFEQCQSIRFGQKLSPEEMDELEALTSRFARLADVVIHKVFRAVEIAELEIPGTLLDTVHRMEKRGLIQSTEQIKDIKELRNTIAHEYSEDDLLLLMKDCQEKTPVLLKILDDTIVYCTSKGYWQP